MSTLAGAVLTLVGFGLMAFYLKRVLDARDAYETKKDEAAARRGKENE